MRSHRLRTFTEWQLGKPDLVLEAGKLIQLPASGRDIYWNFIFTPNLTARRWVRAIEIRPGQPRVVHHANLLVDRTGSAHLQETAPGKGFPGMDLVITRSPFDPDGNFLFWKPGEHAAYRAGRIRLAARPRQRAGAQHAPATLRQARGGAAFDRAVFHRQAADQVPAAGPTGERSGARYPGGRARFCHLRRFQACLWTPIFWPSIRTRIIWESCWKPGHMLPDGSKKWLVRIPDWDPNWQAVYYYREPVFLPKDSVIHMRYHYDNSAANARNPNHPPKRVRAGNQATDEMGHLWLQILPRGAGDRRRELQEAVMRHRLEKNPNDVVAHMNLGAILLSRLDPQAAVTELRAAARLEPNRPEVRNMLGLGLGHAQPERGRHRAI